MAIGHVVCYSDYGSSCLLLMLLVSFLMFSKLCLTFFPIILAKFYPSSLVEILLFVSCEGPAQGKIFTITILSLLLNLQISLRDPQTVFLMKYVYNLGVKGHWNFVSSNLNKRSVWKEKPFDSFWLAGNCVLHFLSFCNPPFTDGRGESSEDRSWRGRYRSRRVITYGISESDDDKKSCWSFWWDKRETCRTWLLDSR